MYKIGDKIFYPFHGAGIIESIEEKEIMGQKHKYYIFRVLVEDMNILIPLENIDNLGIRNIISDYELEEALSILSAQPSDMDKNWNKRYRGNESKIKGGNIKEIAEVVRNLTIIDRNKKLSPGENKIYKAAKMILASEIMCVKGVNIEVAEAIIEDYVKY